MSRPMLLKDFLGQDEAKKQIEYIIKAGQKTNSSIKHTLFYGFSGTGKTTLAHIIANEQGGQIFSINGGSLQTKRDILSLLYGLKYMDLIDPRTKDSKDVIFIDEIHRISLVLAEELYHVLEDQKMDYIHEGKMYTVYFPKFTFIGATTELGMLPTPLLNRFINRIELRPYTNEELGLIIQLYVEKQGREINQESSLSIAKRSKGTPRIAIHNTERCITTAIALGSDLSLEVINKTFDLMGIDEMGLTLMDRRYMTLIKDKPKGLNTLSQTLMEAKDTLAKVIEPYLAQLGFLEFTSRGRILSDAGKKYLQAQEKKTKGDVLLA